MPNVKTAVSLDESLFERAERAACEMKVSRSRLYSLALESYLRRREDQRLLEEINAAYADGLGEEDRAVLRAAARDLARRTEGEW